jgi:hypothetical protein
MRWSIAHTDEFDGVWIPGAVLGRWSVPDAKPSYRPAFQPPLSAPDAMTILLRSDWPVFVTGIPWDLTKAEADRVSRIVLAQVGYAT